MTEYDQKQADEAKLAVEALSDYSNYGHKSKFIVDEVSRQHRTLQQSMFRTMWKCIEHWASLDSGHYDLRNEGTVLACKELIKVFPNGPYLPLV